MKKPFLRGVLVSLLAFGNFCFAQNQLSFERIGTNEGLSQSDVNDIYQDQQGYMWFGTHDGLNKYDGYEFTVFAPDTKKPGSINSNLIFDIVGDKRGNLWIGTTGHGLNHYNSSTQKFTSYRHDKNDSKSLLDDHITTMFLDSKERLWIGTTVGLNMVDIKNSNTNIEFESYNPQQEQFISGLKGNTVHEFFEDSNGQLLVASQRGLFKLSRGKNGEAYFRWINDEIGMPNLVIRSIAEDSFGRLFLGTENGLFYKSNTPNQESVVRLINGHFNKLLIDEENQLWAGTDNGLLCVENSFESRAPILKNRYVYNSQNASSLSKNAIKSLFIDKTGIIWIGTNGGGLSKLDPDTKQFSHIKKTLDSGSLSYDNVTSMFEDSNGTLWIGAEGGGLNKLADRGPNEDYLGFTTIANVPKGLYAIEEVNYFGEKYLFTGGQDLPGLSRIKIGDSKSIQVNDVISVEEIQASVFALLQDDDLNIWIGTYSKGLYRWLWDPINEEYTKQQFTINNDEENSISSKIIRNIFQDTKGNIWIATANGLNKLTKEESIKETPKFEVFKNIKGQTGSISHNYILSIFESSNGTLWIGTLGGGLNMYEEEERTGQGKFKRYSEEDGLPNNVIKGILEDENENLWISTNKGLSRFNPNEVSFKNFDVNDGLQNNEFRELACIKRKSGEMLFGGVNGFNAFFPKNLQENKFVPETVITDFSISNTPVVVGQELNGRVIMEKDIKSTDEIRLKYWESNISFEFASLHYAAPRKNQFAYKLEGFDEDWIFTNANKRFANYTNLEPGNYTMMVKSSNNDGIWDQSPAAVQLVIVPPFWLTKWAYLAYCLLGIGLLFAFRRYTIIRTTEKHELELEHLESEKHEEVNRMKLEFFTNISHEFRTPLTLIKGPLQFLKEGFSEMDEKTISEQFNLMQKNADYLLRLVNQLLDFRKIDRGKLNLTVSKNNIYEFVNEIAEPFQFLKLKRNIDFEIEAQDKLKLVWFDSSALEKILNNLISNAFKFTPENGKITIGIWDSNDPLLPKNLNAKSGLRDAIILEVKDTGPGISNDRLNNIFQRFYFENDKTKQNDQGVGIGLSYAKDLAELHLGSIEVQSEQGKGAKFILKLPLDFKTYENNPNIGVASDDDVIDFVKKRDNIEKYGINLNDEIADKNLIQSRSKLSTLLIVDDNPDIRVFIRHALSNDYLIYEAENGEQGYELATKHLPTIILADIMMPVVDGYELCQKIKSKQETSHIPVIMLTAKTSYENEKEGLLIGADDYIRKPFDIDLLRLKLTNIIKRRKELRKRFNREVSLQPKEVTVTSADEEFLKKAIAIVEKHMTDSNFNVEVLVKEMNFSRTNLYIKFKELTDLSSGEFIRNIRLKRAVQLIENSDMSVKEIMYQTGFNTASYFSKCFKKQFGILPSEYVRQKQNVKKENLMGEIDG